MRELILSACRSNDSKLFSDLRRTFPIELLQAEVAELEKQYQQQFEQLNQHWEKEWSHRYSVEWHGEWVGKLRLISTPIDASDPTMRCQAWLFQSESGQKYYAWNSEHWTEIVDF